MSPSGEGYLEAGFSTNREGQKKSTFNMAIYARDFETLALEMVKANPEAAIKAFGVAMQAAQFPSEPEPTLPPRKMDATHTANTA
jgi:hypothetical protein